MGIHPLDLWDLVIQVFHSSSNQFPSPKRVYRETLLRDTSSSDGNKRTKSNNETPVENPPELPWIGCLTEYNLDSKIQIEFVDTKHQLADLLKRRPPCRREFKTGRWRRRLAVAKPRSVCLVSTSLTISRRIRSWIRRMSKEPREIAGVTLGQNLFTALFKELREKCSGTLSEAPCPKQCRERGKLVSSRSPSSWSITRQHLQRRGADDRDAKFG